MLSLIVTLLVCIPLIAYSVRSIAVSENFTLNVLVILLCAFAILINIGVYFYGKRKI